jgi:proteasome lid subunit RPN8/RPN11
LAVIDDTAACEHLYISQSCVDLVKRAAEAGYPLEICGLLVGQIDDKGWQVNDVRPVANLNTDRAADRFQLDPAAYQAIDGELRGSANEIIGVYHSHPDCPAKPSPTDLASAWEGFAYPIISVCDGQATAMRCWMVNSSGDGFQHIDSVVSAS